MVLTIFYKLKADSEKEAGQLVEQLHQEANYLPFKKVGKIVNLHGDDCNSDKRDRDDPLRRVTSRSQNHHFLKNYPMKEGETETGYLLFPAVRIMAFEVLLGEGTEPIDFGFCLYPKTLNYQGNLIQIELPGWYWSSVCKLYPSDPKCGGIQNFRNCHLAVTAMLNKAKKLGCLEYASEESSLW